MSKSSQTGGVKPMSISGRLVNERERLIGMTDAERAFRKQWLKDQELAPTEPRVVPEIYKATYNPIRRFYRWPLNQVEKALVPIVGPFRALLIRTLAGRGTLVVGLTYWMWYYLKYNGNNWEKKGGVRILKNREDSLPGDVGYPQLSARSKGADYGSRGFDKVTLNL